MRSLATLGISPAGSRSALPHSLPQSGSICNKPLGCANLPLDCAPENLSWRNLWPKPYQ
jgi:hypothetical protein